MLTPDSGERRRAFLNRFMADADMVAEFPLEGRRRNVARSQWRKSVRDARRKREKDSREEKRKNFAEALAKSLAKQAKAEK